MRPILIVSLCLATPLAACTGLPSAVVDCARIPLAPSLRGLSRVDSQTAWVSGSAGVVARSLDGGSSWQSLLVQGAQGLDFRDVYAFSAQSAVLMSSGPGPASRLYRTEDSGASWQLVQTNQEPDGFWDGMAFWNAQRGLLVGDPVDGALTVMATENGGRSWSLIPPRRLPPTLEGEFAFAARQARVQCRIY